ncbi:MAG: STAS domain-containing protein [Magnetococcus sp. MYC-9]
MSCAVVSSGESSVIILPQEFTFNVRDDFRRFLSEKKSLYEVDFQHVEKIDSAAFGMLLLLKENSKTKSADVVLRNVKPEILKMLQLVRFHESFTIVS